MIVQISLNSTFILRLENTKQLEEPFSRKGQFVPLQHILQIHLAILGEILVRMIIIYSNSRIKRWYIQTSWKSTKFVSARHNLILYCLSRDHYKNILGYSSRKKSPEGAWNNATGILEPMEAPGHFTQTLEFFGIQVSRKIKI